MLEHWIHSRNPYLNEICREMGEGLQKKEKRMWTGTLAGADRSVAENVRSHFGGERNFCGGRMRLFGKKHGRK